MNDNEKKIEEYINFRKNIQNKQNEKTLNTEKFVLITFNRSIKNNPFKKVKETEIANYLKKYSNKTKDDRITKIKQFYRWLYDVELGERLPDCVRHIKRTVNSPMEYYNNMDYRERVVTEEEYQALLDNSRMMMHKAMIETLYCFGCRASELLSMNAQDVVYNDGITKIKVRKSKKIPREIIYEGRPEYLMKWFENYQHFKGKKDKPLWTNSQKNKYNRYTIAGLEKAIKVTGKRANLRRITPHDFRHTAITNARKNGEKDTHIQSNFGLTKTSAMMGVYAHNKIKDFEEEVKKRIKNPKPTYELMEKQKKTLEEKHEKDIKELKENFENMTEWLKYFVNQKQDEKMPKILTDKTEDLFIKMGKIRKVKASKEEYEEHKRELFNKKE